MYQRSSLTIPSHQPMRVRFPTVLFIYLFMRRRVCRVVADGVVKIETSEFVAATRRRRAVEIIKVLDARRQNIPEVKRGVYRKKGKKIPCKHARTISLDARRG